jgi:hypothetical protein
MANTEDGKKSPSPFRASIAIAVGFIILAYTTLVVAGVVPKDRRIDNVTLAIIVAGVLCCVLLLKPNLMERLRLLELRGFKVEVLERLQERQIQQQSDLEDIRLIIPILLPEEERKHLLNVAHGKTADYKGGEPLRIALRRLCTIGLLRRRQDRQISDLHSSTKFNLADWVELTKLGRGWVHRLEELDGVAMNVPKSDEK